MVEVTAAGDDARARYRSALARFTPFLEEGRQYANQGEELPADTARFAIGGAASMIFDEIRAGRGPELTRILPDLVFAVLMPYLGPEAAEDEMRRVTREHAPRRPELDALAVATGAAGEALGAFDGNVEGLAAEPVLERDALGER